MAITDLDADGNKELWTFDNLTHQYKVYEWTAPETYSLIYSEHINETAVADIHEVLVLDWNADGKRDYFGASTNYTDAYNLLFFSCNGSNNGIFLRGYCEVSGYSYDPDQLIYNNFDTDNNFEFFVSPAGGGDTQLVEISPGFQPQYSINVIDTIPSSQAKDFATCDGDFDKDGIRDFFTGGTYDDPYIRLFEDAGDEQWDPVWSMPSGLYGCSLGTGDSDLDGWNELYVNDEYGNNVSVFECTGDNMLAFRTQLNSPGGAGCFNVVDTDGNSQKEIIFEVNYSPGYKQIRAYEATGSNTWTSKWNSTAIPGVPGNVFAVDIDSDLYCELITNSWNNTRIFQCNVANGTYNPPTGLSISINGGATQTKYTNVSLTIAATGATEMCFSNDNLTYSTWEPYSTIKAWNLTVGPAGIRTVYFRARSSQGTANAAWDTIINLGIPATPTLLPITPSTTYLKSVWLNWTQVPLATNYSVYRSLSPISDVTGLIPLINVSAMAKSYLDNGMEANHTYYYVVTANNAEGQSDPSTCQSVNVTVPNLFQNMFSLLAKVDPLTREIISYGINFIGNITGSNVVGFLTSNGDVVISRTFALGNIAAEMGLCLQFMIGLQAHLNTVENRVEFTFATNLNTAFDLSKLKFQKPFDVIDKLFRIMEKMGVSLSAKLIASLNIKFYFDADDLSCGLMNVCVRINPSIEATVKLLPLLLNLKPEVKQVFDFIQKPIAKYLNYDIYNIIVTKIELGVNLVAQYDAVHTRFTADVQLVLNIKAELDICQPSKVKTPEVALRLEGLVGIHFDTDPNPHLSFCGALTFVARVNTGELGFLRYVLNPILNRAGFAPNRDHPIPIVVLGSGCSGLVSCTPIPAAGDPDNDSDYLTDAQEIALGTNLTHPDTDSDGIWDYLEVLLGSDPLSGDSDNDTLSDYDEYFVIHSNLLSNDTDGDGLSDAEEWFIYGTDLWSNDSDGDGLLDAEEILMYGTLPLNSDSDGDGYEDGFEQLWYGTDPNSASSVPADTDGDGLLDKDEVEIYKTSPSVSNDGDADGDKLSDIQEMLLGSNLNAADTDNDGLSDYDEYYIYHTYFNDADSDGDGYTDGEEVQRGFNPLDASSHPLMQSWLQIVIVTAASFVGIIGVRRFTQKKRKNQAPQKTEDLDWDGQDKSINSRL